MQSVILAKQIMQSHHLGEMSALITGEHYCIVKFSHLIYLFKDLISLYIYYIVYLQ